jgi:hypothetical protein
MRKTVTYIHTDIEGLVDRKFTMLAREEADESEGFFSKGCDLFQA